MKISKTSGCHTALTHAPANLHTTPLRTLCSGALTVALWALASATTVTAQEAPGARQSRVTDVAVGNRAKPSIEHLDAVKKAGFDYVELGLENTAKLSESELLRLREHAVRKLGLPVLAGAYLLPATVPITGPQVDEAEQMKFVRARLALAAQLRMSLVIFGSGDVPAGFPRDQAFKQLVDFARRAATEAAAKRIVLVLQPLQREKSEFAAGSNFINTVGDALRVVEAVNHPNLGITVDLYHLHRAGEKPDVLRTAGKQLRHVMISNPDGRRLPTAAGEYDYAGFFAALRQIDYRGLVTVFAMGTDGVDTQSYAARAPASIAFVRQAAARPVAASCAQAFYGGRWVNQSFAAQSGVFTAEFDATPSSAGISSAIIISDGPTGGKSNGPVFIHFDHVQGRLLIRQAGRGPVSAAGQPGNYRADREVKYAGAARHRFRVVADVPRQSFSVYVTLPGGTEQALAVDYPFEKPGNNPVAALSNIATDVQIDITQPPDTRMSVCNLRVRADAPSANTPARPANGR